MSANDLADRLDEHAAYDLLTPEDVDTVHAAAVLLREQAEQLDIQTALATNYAGKAVEYKQEKERAEEQLDTLLNAIGNPADLRLLAGGVGVNTPGTRRHWGRIADALDALAAAGGGVPGEGATDE